MGNLVNSSTHQLTFFDTASSLSRTNLANPSQLVRKFAKKPYSIPEADTYNLRTKMNLSPACFRLTFSFPWLQTGS